MIAKADITPSILHSDPKFIDHYINGGVFEATYNPPNTAVITQNVDRLIGKTIRVWQNIQTSPILAVKYRGQHRFNAQEVHGWFPECDIQDLKILENEFIENVEPIPQYMFAMLHTNRESIFKNFGKGYEHRDYVVAFRDYSSDTQSYVMSLGKPQADLITKAVWYGEPLDQIKWTIIHKNPDFDETPYKALMML